MVVVYRLAMIVMMGVAGALAVQNTRAEAHTSSDGNWSVVVSGQNGSCQGGSYNYALQIVNGVIYYPGTDARITGRVSQSGAVYVRVFAGDRSAVGSGRLSHYSGGGSFRGQSSSGMCAGTWSAHRMGG
jgi:hypothetical protein